MNGATHKAIGFATGAAIVTYAVLTEQPLMAFGIVTAPIGAMLPDIDHHNSKLGRQKDTVFKFIKKFSRIAMVAAAVILIVSIFLSALGTVSPICLSVILIGLLINIVLSKTLAEKIPFFTKHRGVMHTLLLPALLLAFSNFTGMVVVKSLVFGLAIGYISHLYADSLTVEGCPLVWPISQECVGPRLIKTGSVAEYICAVLLSLCIIGYAIMLSKDMGYILLVFVVLIIPVCDILSRKFCKKARTKRGSIVKRVILVLVIGGLVLVVFMGDISAKILAGSVIAGIVLGVIHTHKICS